VSAVVGVSAEGVRIPISRERIARVARAVLDAGRVRDAMLSITFVSNARIRSMNRKHLGRNGATDVISFGFRRAGKRAPVVGDVYIAPDVARESARENRVPVREELVRLVVHGTLHVLGHDHPDSDARTRSPMWRKQEALVRRLANRR
jgi:probable rRNA maturation factor